MAKIIKTIKLKLTEEETKALEKVKEIFDTLYENDGDDSLYEDCIHGCPDNFEGMIYFIESILEKSVDT